MTTQHEWDLIAPYYDDLFKGRTEDIPFWVKLAKKVGSPVLELACGTGRITIAIARAGLHITGIDISGPMLMVARKKIQKEPRRVRGNITLSRGDVTGFSLKAKKFNAIFSTWGFLPITEHQQNGLFSAVRAHLSSQGVFVVDIDNLSSPTEDWSTAKIKEYIQLPKKKLTLLRWAFNSGSAETKLGRIIFILDVIRHDGTLKKFVTHRKFRLYTKKDLIHLLYSHGFQVLTVYGGYDFSPWSPTSHKAIIVSRQIGKSLWARLLAFFTLIF